jgi:signal transduction histidine kinase
MSDAIWLVLVGPDGVVLLASGGAPTSWVGSNIADLEDLPTRVREAGRALVDGLHHAAPSVAGFSRHVIPELPERPTLDIVAVEAIPVRRMTTDLAGVLRASMEVLDAQARSLDIDLGVESAPDVPTDASLDPEKIAWAVMTLVGNAMRYVRRGTRRMPGGSIKVKLDFVAESGDLVVAVEDDGPGIPPEKLPWLFRRADGGAHAAGLGLMLVHDVVAAHGGSIGVESSTSSADHGTRVTMRLPVR